MFTSSITAQKTSFQLWPYLHFKILKIKLVIVVILVHVQYQNVILCLVIGYIVVYLCDYEMMLLHYFLLVISLTVLTVKTMNANTYAYANQTCDDFGSAQTVSVLNGINISFDVLSQVYFGLLQVLH